jgi:hypothetical protein
VGSEPTTVSAKQGDQTGGIVAQWPIVYFVQILEKMQKYPKSSGYFFPNYRFIFRGFFDTQLTRKVLSNHFE